MLKRQVYAKPLVVWICGPTGTGKSALALYLCGPDRFRKCGELKWFDGYNGQENVTFDDFRKANCEWSFLLNILDHYKVDDMPVKGGFVPWRPKMIVFTSPNPPHVEFTRPTKKVASTAERGQDRAGAQTYRCHHRSPYRMDIRGRQGRRPRHMLGSRR